LRGVISELYKSPLPVLADQDGYSSFVTAEDVYLLYRGLLYDPGMWPVLAKVLASAASGDGTILRAAVPLPGSLIRGDRSLATENVFNRTTQITDGTEVTQSILCGDQSAETLATLKNSTNEWWVQYADKVSSAFLKCCDHRNDQQFMTPPLVSLLQVRKEGWTTTEYLLNLVHGCRSYQTVSYERYAGPFSVAQGLRPFKNTILLVGNTHDPITPSGARTMAEGFGEESASLLINDARGHTTLYESSVSRHSRSRNRTPAASTDNFLSFVDQGVHRCRDLGVPGERDAASVRYDLRSGRATRLPSRGSLLRRWERD
jgi:hypothetical protein